MLELQTSVYREILELPPCDECEGASCAEPYGLTRDGFAVERATGPDIVVSWPACPRRFERLRRLGSEVVQLGAICSWSIERRVHMRRLPAWSSRLLRHYTMARDVPESLRAARDRKRAELARLARGGR